MSTTSCFSILLCRRKKNQSKDPKPRKAKSIDLNTPRLNFSSKFNLNSDQAPRMRISLPHIDTLNSVSLASHRSSIAVKSAGKFLPLIQSQEKSETTGTEYT